jgi:hypothetical protein
VLNASVLPDGVCDTIPAHGGGDLCTRSDLFPDSRETVNFMLGPSDAIVFYGCTPPPVDYFGYDFIVTTRLTGIIIIIIIIITGIYFFSLLHFPIF